MEKDDLAQDKRMIKKAVGMHEMQAHGGKKTNLAKLKKGGPTGDDMMRMGRNMARAKNQGSK